jgi:hypothetical protein
MQTSFARVQAIAASTALPGIEAGTSYGTPGLKVAGKFLARMKDEETLVVRCPLEEKSFLMQADPAIFYETDHYTGYPAVLVRLDAADDAAIAGRLEAAWRMQAPKRLQAAHAKAR